jgi:hypothetical protein
MRGEGPRGVRSRKCWRRRACLKVPAEGAWGLGGDPFEKNAHVFGMPETGEFRDAFEGEVRFREKLFDAADLGVSNLRLRGTLQVPAEPPFQGAAREAHLVEHVLDGAAVHGLFPDEPDRRGDVPIIDRKNIGGLPCDHSERGNRDPLSRRRLTAHQAVKQFGRVTVQQTSRCTPRGSRRWARCDGPWRGRTG